MGCGWVSALELGEGLGEVGWLIGNWVGEFAKKRELEGDEGGGGELTFRRGGHGSLKLDMVSLTVWTIYIPIEHRYAQKTWNKK